MSLKNFLKPLFFFSVFVGLLFLSVYGTEPKDSQKYPLGPMQVSSVESGITLSQGYQSNYYTVSPFNDFYINSTGVKSTLITKNEIKNKTYKNSLNSSKIQKIIDTVTSYFDLSSPKQKFTSKSGVVKYTTDIEKNKAVITYTFTPTKNITLKRLGITLTYNATDLIFDEKGNLYNSFTTQDIKNFEKIYNFDLTPQKGELHQNIQGEKIHILNPKGAYLLTIEAQKGEEISLNKNAKIIEISQIANKINDSYTTSIYLNISKSPKEILP